MPYSRTTASVRGHNNYSVVNGVIIPPDDSYVGIRSEMRSTVRTRDPRTIRTDASGAATSHRPTRRPPTSTKSKSWCCLTSEGDDEENPPPRPPRKNTPPTGVQAVQPTRPAPARSPHANTVSLPESTSLPTCQSFPHPQRTGDVPVGVSKGIPLITIEGGRGNYKMLVKGNGLFVFHEGLASVVSAGDGNMITDHPPDKGFKALQKLHKAAVTITQNGEEYQVVVTGGHVEFDVPKEFSVERK